MHTLHRLALKSDHNLHWSIHDFPRRRGHILTCTHTVLASNRAKTLSLSPLLTSLRTSQLNFFGSGLIDSLYQYRCLQHLLRPQKTRLILLRLLSTTAISKSNHYPLTYPTLFSPIRWTIARTGVQNPPTLHQWTLDGSDAVYIIYCIMW